MTFTQQQYQDALLRLRRNLKREPASEIPPAERETGVSKEAELHDQIMAECKRRGWLAFHGSMAHRTHRSIGEPDFIVVAEGGRVFFLEAKRKGSKPTQEQQAIIAWLTRLGASAHIVYSLQDVLNIFREPATSISETPSETSSSRSNPSSPQ